MYKFSGNATKINWKKLGTVTVWMGHSLEGLPPLDSSYTGTILSSHATILKQNGGAGG